MNIETPIKEWAASGRLETLTQAHEVEVELLDSLRVKLQPYCEEVEKACLADGLAERAADFREYPYRNVMEYDRKEGYG